MKKFHILQLIGFTLEIFSFVSIVISLISNTGSRSPLYLLFMVGVLFVASGNLIKRNQK